MRPQNNEHRNHYHGDDDHPRLRKPYAIHFAPPVWYKPERSNVVAAPVYRSVGVGLAGGGE
jgi:hypothetical protein